MDFYTSIAVGLGTLVSVLYFGPLIYRRYYPLSIAFYVPNNLQFRLHKIEDQPDAKPWDPSPEVQGGGIVISNKSDQPIELASVKVKGSNGELKPTGLTRKAPGAMGNSVTLIGAGESATYTLNLRKSDSGFRPKRVVVSDRAGRTWKKRPNIIPPDQDLPSYN